MLEGHPALCTGPGGEQGPQLCELWAWGLYPRSGVASACLHSPPTVGWSL